jgi:hypothetical protein
MSQEINLASILQDCTSDDLSVLTSYLKYRNYPLSYSAKEKANIEKNVRDIMKKYNVLPRGDKKRKFSFFKKSKKEDKLTRIVNPIFQSRRRVSFRGPPLATVCPAC